jgi:signal transduction histidine kinase
VPERLPVAASPAVTAVFAELVRNAIEHNDREHPTVTVDVDEVASDGRYVVVRVSDDGPGIGEQERRVIDRGRETPLDHGSGIGLWMANWVVERAGGQLSIENEKTGGVVSVSLPRATEDGVDDVAADA